MPSNCWICSRSACLRPSPTKVKNLILPAKNPMLPYFTGTTPSSSARQHSSLIPGTKSPNPSASLVLRKDCQEPMATMAAASPRLSHTTNPSASSVGGFPTHAPSHRSSSASHLSGPSPTAAPAAAYRSGQKPGPEPTSPPRYSNETEPAGQFHKWAVEPISQPVLDQSPGARRSGRQPKKRSEPVQLDFQTMGLNRREQKMLKLALAKSVVETKLERATSCPQARIFYPTLEEFASPMAYISSIQAEAEKTGICKIVPPVGWKPPFSIDLDDPSLLFETRVQNIHQLQEGVDYGDGRTHNFRSYQMTADAFRDQWLRGRGLDPATVTSEQIEQEYWRIVESGDPVVKVEYANDLDTTRVGSGFPRVADPFNTVAKGKEVVDFSDPAYYQHTAWNLNNLPFAHGSLLRHMHSKINGINVPWLYCGMLFATFCWHTEDNHMYSVNYQHIGAKKRWYGIPSTHSDGFERVLKQRVPERFREVPDLLFHLTTMVPPSALQAQDVEVYTLIQEPGDIVITFPRAYHSGYSEGFNCNEASNFVLPSWIQYSRESIERYREVGRSSIFSHDRFMFHFGSTQSLEEYRAEECEMLLRELRVMFQEEQRLKKELESLGLEHVLELSADVMLDDKSMELDEVRECYLCKHNVFFSGVTCTCNPSILSCLRHSKSMCKCPIEDRTLIQWVSAAEMRYAIRRVQVKIQTLRRQEHDQESGGDVKKEEIASQVEAEGPANSTHGAAPDPHAVIDLT